MIKRKIMYKGHHIKSGTILTLIVLAGFITTSDLQQDLVGKLFAIPFENHELHWEESFLPDFNELNRDKGTAAATGTNTVMTFGENN